MTMLYFFMSIHLKSPNCFQPSGVGKPSPIRVYCEAKGIGGGGDGEEECGEKVLAIQIWSPNAVKAILKLNSGLTLERY